MVGNGVDIIKDAPNRYKTLKKRQKVEKSKSNDTKNHRKNIFKIIKGEFNDIKWVSTKNILKQTLFAFIIIVALMVVYSVYDTCIQMLLSLIIK